MDIFDQNGNITAIVRVPKARNALSLANKGHSPGPQSMSFRQTKSVPLQPIRSKFLGWLRSQIVSQ